MSERETTPTDQQVERVAVAIWTERETRRMGRPPDPRWWAMQGEEFCDRFRTYARVAIGAMEVAHG